MAFGAKIKLTVDKSNQSQFRTEIQAAVDAATRNGIKISSFKATLDGDSVATLTKAVQDSLNKGKFDIKINKIDASDAVKNLRKQLTTMLSGLSITGLKDFIGVDASSSALEKAAASAERLAEAHENVQRKAVASSAAIKEIGQIQNILNASYRDSFKLGDPEGAEVIQQAYREISAEIQRAKTLEGEAQQQAIIGAAQSAAALRETVAGYREQAAAAANASKTMADFPRVAKLHQQVTSYIEQNADAYRAFKAEFDDISDSLVGNPAAAAANIDAYSSRFTQLREQVKAFGFDGQAAFGAIESAWGKLADFFSFAKMFSALRSAMRQVIDVAKELDAAMTELRKVTDLATEDYDRYMVKAGNMAKEIGASVSDTIQATADFSRLGFDLGDAADLAEAALVYRNIGDGVNSIDDATGSIISTMKAFNMTAEDAAHIVDAFNEVGNNFAITSGGIGDALTRSAAAMSAAGSTMEESIGLITAANEIIQNPESVGTAMKTLSMYLRATKTEAEEAGIATDGMASSTSKLREELMLLTSGTSKPLDIMLDESTFKAPFQILGELSEIWDEIADVDRANILERMGGKRNANVLSALITNFDRAREAAETAADSTGSAWIENEKYLDSINGKIKDLTASFEALSGGIVNSSVTKWLLSAATALLDLLGHFNDFGLLIPSIIGAMAGLSTVFKSGVVGGYAEQIGLMMNAGKSSMEILGTMSGVVTKLNGQQRALLLTLVEQLPIMDGVDEQVKENIISVLSGTAANGQYAISFKSLKTAVSNSMATMSGFAKAALGLSAAMAAIGIISGIVNKAKEAQKAQAEAVRESLEEYAEATKAADDNIATLESLREEMNELGKGLDENGNNVSLTASEYERYIDLVSQIVGISPSVIQGYNDEKQAIIDYRTAIDEAIESQKEMQQRQKDILLSQSRDTLKAAGKKYDDAVDNSLIDRQTFGKALEATFRDADISPTQWEEYIGSALNHIGATWDDAYINDTFFGMSLGNAIEESFSVVYEKGDEFIAYLGQLKDESGKQVFEEDALDGLRTYIAAFADDVTALEEAVSFAQPLFDLWAGRNEGILGGLPQNLVMPGLQGVFAEQIKNGNKDYSLIEDALDDYLAGFIELINSSYAQSLDKAIIDLNNGDITIDDYNKAVSDAFKTADEARAEALAELESGAITKEQYDATLLAIGYDEWAGVYVFANQAQKFEDLEAYYTNAGEVATSTSEAIEESLPKIESLADSLERLQNGYELLEKAQAEMNGGHGLSMDTVSTILGSLEEGENPADFLYAENGLIQLNVEKWKERTKAMAAGSTETLHVQKAELEEEVKALENSATMSQAIANELYASGYFSRSGEYAAEAESTRLELEVTRAELDAITQQLELFEAALAGVGNTNIDLNGMSDELKDAQTNITSLYDAIENVKNDGTMSMTELFDLAYQFPEMWQAIGSGEFDLSTAVGQMEMLSSVTSSYEQQFRSMILSQLALLNKYIGEQTAAGTLTEEETQRVQAIKQALIALMNIEFGADIASETDKISEAFDSALNAVNVAKEGIELLRNVDNGTASSGDIIGWLSDVSKDAEALGIEPINIADYFYADGSVNAAGLQKLVDILLMIPEIQAINPELAQSLRDEAKAAEEAASASEQFNHVLSQIENVQSFREAFEGRDADPLAALNAALELAGDNIESLKLIMSFDGGKLQFTPEGIEKFILATALSEDQLNELVSAFPGFNAWMQAACEATSEATNVFDVLSESIGNVGDAFDLIGEIQLGESSTLDILSSMLDYAESTGADIGSIISQAFTGSGFNAAALESMGAAQIVNLAEQLRQIPGVGTEAANAISALIYEEQRAELTSQNLSTALNRVQDAASLIADIESGDGDFASMFQTASEMARLAGVDVETFYSDGVWNIDAVRAFGEEYIDYALEMQLVSEDAAKGMREMIAAVGDVKSPKIQIEAETESLTKVVAAVNESASATGLSIESIELLMDRYGELEGYDVDKLFDYTATGIKMNSDAMRDLESQYADSKIEEYENQVIRLREQYDALTQQMQDAEYGSAEWLDLASQQDSLASQINEVAALAAQYRGLTSSYNDWLNTRDGAEDGDMYDNMTSGLKEAYDLLNAGLIGTNEFAAYTQMFTDEDLSGKSAEYIAGVFEDAYPKIKRYFTEGVQGCENFAKDLAGLEGNLTDANGELIEFAEYNAETGKYSFDMNAETMAAAAKELGISQEAMGAIFLKLADYGWEIDIDPAVADLELLQKNATTASETLNTAGTTDYEFHFGTGNIDRVDEQLEVAQQTLADLTAGENPLPMDDSQVKAAQDIVAALMKEKQELEKPTVMKVQAGGIAGNLGETVRTIQKVQEASENLEMQISIGADQSTIDAAQAEVDAALQQLQGQDEDVLVSLGIDPTSLETFQTSLTNLDENVLIKAGIDATLIDGYLSEEHTAEGTLRWKNDDAAQRAFKAIMHQAHGEVVWNNDISRVKTSFSATGTVRWNNTYGSADGTAHADGTVSSGNAFAHGYWGTRDAGTALMGELGPELIVRDGRFFTVGDDGAGFYRYQKGDIIFNAAQTREIFEKGKLVGAKRRGQVYMDGTAYAEGSSFASGSSVSASGGFYVSKLTSSSSTQKQTKTASSSTSKKNANNIEKIKTKYEELNATLEHLIAHQEFLYEQSERGLDYDGMRASLTEQAALYKEMMENAQTAVKEMQAKGATDATKELQEMEEVYWDAYSKFHDMLDEINVLHVDALNDHLDDIQKAFDNLSSAAEEYEKYGGISVDTYQDLLEHGIQYLSLLEKQDGQYMINRESIEALIAAEKEQLALESALSYLGDLQIALSEGNANMVDSLVDSSQKISDATWDNVYAQASLLQELGLTGDQYNIVIQNLQALQAVADEVITDITTDLDDAKDSLDDLYDEQLDALENILDLVQDLIEYETDAQIEAIEDQIDAFRELVNLKKESLKTTKDESDYEEDIAEKVKEIAEIQNRVDLLSLDDSRAARAEEAELMAELAELQKELAESQQSHALDKQTEALDELADAYEESRQPEIEALENSISSAEKLYRLAIERISNGWDTLYGDLIDWNYEAGNSLNSEITERWNAATEAVKEYGSYLEALNVLQEKTGSVTNYGEQSFVVADVNKLPRYHNGGVVGNEASINEEEVVAVLKKNEIVIDDGKKSVLYKIIDFQQALSEKLGRAIGSLGSPNAAFAFAGAGSATVDPIQTTASATIHFNPQISVGINAEGGLKQSEALKFGERIAQTTLDKLHEAFERKGIGSLRGSLLRQ